MIFEYGTMIQALDMMSKSYLTLVRTSQVMPAPGCQIEWNSTRSVLDLRNLTRPDTQHNRLPWTPNHKTDFTQFPKLHLRFTSQTTLVVHGDVGFQRTNFSAVTHVGLVHVDESISIVWVLP